jgi:hypothetical protein
MLDRLEKWCFKDTCDFDQLTRGHNSAVRNMVHVFPYTMLHCSFIKYEKARLYSMWPTVCKEILQLYQWEFVLSWPCPLPFHPNSRSSLKLYHAREEAKKKGCSIRLWIELYCQREKYRRRKKFWQVTFMAFIST